jgi:hypothetical protein
LDIKIDAEGLAEAILILEVEGGTDGESLEEEVEGKEAVGAAKIATEKGEDD